MPLTTERKLRAQQAAFARWSREDAREGTEPARAGWYRKFEDRVDPERVLSPDERAVRVERAIKSHMTGLALRSAKARRKAAADG